MESRIKNTDHQDYKLYGKNLKNQVCIIYISQFFIHGFKHHGNSIVTNR